MNVMEVPTDSGLGVYHEVPWATISGPTEPETSVSHFMSSIKLLLP